MYMLVLELNNLQSLLLTFPFHLYHIPVVREISGAKIQLESNQRNIINSSFIMALGESQQMKFSFGELLEKK